MQVDGVGLRFFRGLAGPPLGRSAGFGFKGKLHVMNDAGAFSSVRFYDKCVSKMCICVSTCLFVTLWSRCGLVMVYSRSRCGLVMVSVFVVYFWFLFGVQ